MHLTYEITQDRRTLIIRADEDARAELAELSGEEIQQDRHLYDAFERLLCNSELAWIAPETCGDMTSAPILGILGETVAVDSCQHGDGTVLAGRWPDADGKSRLWVEPVVERWGFMDYAIKSPLEDLLNRGEARFTAP